MHLSKHTFGSQELQEYLRHEVHFFFENVENLMHIPKMR